jgi:hypothetical protein
MAPQGGGLMYIHELVIFLPDKLVVFFFRAYFLNRQNIVFLALTAILADYTRY